MTTIAKRFTAAAALALAIPFSASAPGAAAPPPRGQELLELYSRIHTALAADRSEGVRESAQALATRAEALSRMAEAPAAYQAVAAAARAVDAEQLGALREQFRGLSRAMAALVDATGAAGAQLYYCSMAAGYWLQPSAEREVRNPYYGSGMLDCGERVQRVERSGG